MFLTSELSSKIIDEVKNLIDEHLIIVNHKGTILASTDANRVGNFHEGAMIACQEKRNVIITSEDESRLQGVKAGINLPILFNHQPIGVIGITGNPSKVTPFGSLVKKMTELLIQENFYFQQLEWEARTLESFVFSWLQEDTVSEQLINKGTLLGLDMYSDKRCVLVKLLPTNQTITHNQLHETFHWLKKSVNGIVVRRGNDRFVLLHYEITDSSKKEYMAFYQRFQQWLVRQKLTASIGIGSKLASESISESYHQAEKALAIASKQHPIIFYEQLQLELCLQDIKTDTKEEFVTKTIGKLRGDLELIDTLKVYYEHNLNLSQAAKELNIHINTIHYRLNRIHEITLLNPKKVKPLITLYLALTFLDELEKTK